MLTIRARDFSRVIAERLRRDTDVVRAAALDTVLWGEAQAVKQTNALDLVDLGAYKLGWAHRAIARGAELGNPVPYAPVIEYGRRPNRPGPPLQPIIEWVHRKLRGEIRGQYRASKAIALGLAAAGAKSRREAAQRRRDVRSAFGSERNAMTASVIFVAMAIRDAIHARGSKPKRVLRGVYVAMKPRFAKVAIQRLRAKKR